MTQGLEEGPVDRWKGQVGASKAAQKHGHGRGNEIVFQGDLPQGEETLPLPPPLETSRKGLRLGPPTELVFDFVLQQLQPLASKEKGPGAADPGTGASCEAGDGVTRLRREKAGLAEGFRQGFQAATRIFVQSPCGMAEGIGQTRVGEGQGEASPGTMFHGPIRAASPGEEGFPEGRRSPGSGQGQRQGGSSRREMKTPPLPQERHPRAPVERSGGKGLRREQQRQKQAEGPGHEGGTDGHGTPFPRGLSNEATFEPALEQVHPSIRAIEGVAGRNGFSPGWITVHLLK